MQAVSTDEHTTLTDKARSLIAPRSLLRVCSWRMATRIPDNNGSAGDGTSDPPESEGDHPAGGRGTAAARGVAGCEPGAS